MISPCNYQVLKLRNGMMTEFPHLYPASRAVAAMSAEERIHRIRADRWIAYPRAQAALAKLEELISFPERARMPNLLIVGASGMGKTMIIEKFVRDHPASFQRHHRPFAYASRCSSDGFRPRRGAVLSPDTCRYRRTRTAARDA